MRTHYLVQAVEVAAAPALAGAALEKLKQAHEMVMRAGGGDTRLTRLAYQLGAQMAREQLVAQDPASARRLLQSVSGKGLASESKASHAITPLECHTMLVEADAHAWGAVQGSLQHTVLLKAVLYTS